MTETIFVKTTISNCCFTLQWVKLSQSLYKISSWSTYSGTLKSLSPPNQMVHHVINIVLYSEKLWHIKKKKDLSTGWLVCHGALICGIKFNFKDSFIFHFNGCLGFFTFHSKCFKAVWPAHYLKYSFTVSRDQHPSVSFPLCLSNYLWLFLSFLWEQWALIGLWQHGRVNY